MSRSQKFRVSNNVSEPRLRSFEVSVSKQTLAATYGFHSRHWIHTRTESSEILELRLNMERSHISVKISDTVCKLTHTVGYCLFLVA